MGAEVGEMVVDGIGGLEAGRGEAFFLVHVDHRMWEVVVAVIGGVVGWGDDELAAMARLPSPVSCPPTTLDDDAIGDQGCADEDQRYGHRNRDDDGQLPMPSSFCLVMMAMSLWGLNRRYFLAPRRLARRCSDWIIVALRRMAGHSNYDGRIGEAELRSCHRHGCWLVEIASLRVRWGIIVLARRLNGWRG